MRNMLVVLAVMSSLGLSPGAYADSHEDAYVAVERGDFTKAVRFWKKLADRGDEPHPRQRDVTI